MLVRRLRQRMRHAPIAMCMTPFSGPQPPQLGVVGESRSLTSSSASRSCQRRWSRNLRWRRPRTLSRRVRRRRSRPVRRADRSRSHDVRRGSSLSGFIASAKCIETESVPWGRTSNVDCYETWCPSPYEHSDSFCQPSTADMSRSSQRRTQTSDSAASAAPEHWPHRAIAHVGMSRWSAVRVSEPAGGGEDGQGVRRDPLVDVSAGYRSPRTGFDVRARHPPLASGDRSAAVAVAARLQQRESGVAADVAAAVNHDQINEN